MIDTIFRVAVIGCGGIATVHAGALSENPQTQLVACVDIDPARADAFAKKYGCKPYISAVQMLETERLDAVHICTPHATHFPLLQQAVAHKVAVFTEKPPTTTRADFATLLTLAENHPIGVCFQNRYNDSVVAVKQRFDAGEFGALQGVRGFVTWHREMPYYNAAPWRASQAQAAGGCLINQSIHTLDLMLLFLGKPDAISAQTSQLHLAGVIEVEDSLHALLQYRDGKRGVFYATNGYHKNAPVLLELSCQHATVRVEETDIMIRWNDGREAAVETQQFIKQKAQGKDYWGTSHARCIADFYTALTESRPFANAPSSAKITMDTVFSIYESARQAGVMIGTP